MNKGDECTTDTKHQQYLSPDGNLFGGTRSLNNCLSMDHVLGGDQGVSPVPHKGTGNAKDKEGQ